MSDGAKDAIRTMETIMKCVNCGSSSWRSSNDGERGSFAVCDDCGHPCDYPGISLEEKPLESSGNSSSYYNVRVDCPLTMHPYNAECGDISNALELNIQEVNIFKEIWRTAAARQGRGKKDHSNIRAAEKIKFFADRNLQLVKFKEG